MTVIKATSPCCGAIVIGPPAITVYRMPEPYTSWYALKCPCGSTVNKPADDGTIAVLRAGGVRVHDITLERHQGPPLTGRDLYDLRLDLALMEREGA